MLAHKFEALDQKISVLCLGTMNFGDTMTEEESFQVMDAFSQMGGNFIDTARVYGAFGPNGHGASEKVIGHWIATRNNRERLVIGTKGGHPPIEGERLNRLDKENLTSDLNESLEALAIKTIDIYWLHRDDPTRPVEDILETLNGFVASGKIRSFGTSNWTPERIAQANEAAKRLGIMGFSANQPMWSLADPVVMADKTMCKMDPETYRFHEANGMLCVPYTSQAKGFFPKMAAGGSAWLSGEARERYLSDHNLRLFEATQKIARETGLSESAIALAFLTAQPNFSVSPIVGVSNMEQVDALREASNARLTKDQLNRLLTLSGLTE
ncbi:MAG: aldo/keto reductase [Clostridia bacterium]